jgi:hypothetical protein
MLFLKKSYGVIALRPVPHGGLGAQEGGHRLFEKNDFYRAIIFRVFVLLQDIEETQQKLFR